MIRLRVAAAVIAMTAAPLAAQEQRPSLSAGRVTGEIFAGTYAGIGGFFAGRYLGESLSNAMHISNDRTRDRVSRTTAFLAAGLATAGAVYAVGNIADETGDFGPTLLGTGVGFAGALTVAHLTLGGSPGTLHGSSTAARWAVVNALAFLPAVGATVGFNSSRSYR